MSIKATIVDPQIKKYLQNAKGLGASALNGIGCTAMVESIPIYDAGGCEIVRSGRNNTQIVLGRDRPSNQFSGCGGRGDSHCGMIDLVAGRVSSVIMDQLKRDSSKPFDSKYAIDNNFFADAARVYISQRVINVDEYLGFKNEKGSSSQNLSTVIVKSDCTRVVGRESVRIYAGGARADGFGPFGEKRADGSDIDNPRIELIVGNQGEDDMQPAVLGQHLVAYLKKNNEISNKKIKILQSLIKQVTVNTAALLPLTFGAMGSVAAQQAAENIQNIRSLLTALYNETINDMNYLNDAIVPGANSILSKNVFIT